MLDHKNLQTTQIYARVIDEKKRDAVNKIILKLLNFMKRKSNRDDKSKIVSINEDAELDKYIVDNFNNEIYQDLQNVWKPFLFLTTPLEFFRELYSDFNWILENKHRPRAITEHFQTKSIPVRTYYLKKLKELLQRKLEGKYKIHQTRLLDSESEEYKQLEEAKENIQKMCRNEENDLTISFIQHSFVDEIDQAMKSLPDSEKENYIRGKAKEYFKIPEEDRRIYELKKFDLTNWFLAGIELYESKEKNMNEKENSEAKEADFTLRRKVLILMLLTFGRLDLPQDLIKQTVVEFFHGLTGGNIKNLQDLLSNPTYHKGTNRSIKRLCDDLHFVRSQLEKLGLSENIKTAISEIDYLIDELEQKN